MKKNLPQKVYDSVKKHMRHKNWRRFVTALACVVVFCTTYALILPAVTMSGEVYCGKEAHTHTQEECYERVLICGLEETGTAEAASGHTHTDDCYETKSVLICERAEGEGHIHTADCYMQTFVCGLEASEGHTHTDACLDEGGNLICGQEESAGHIHSESCCTAALTCGLEEAEGHIHCETCYREERVPVCGQEESEAAEPAPGHVHTDACYEKTQVCRLEEHAHSLACYSNPEADVESAYVWERTIPQNLGGSWAENVVAVANSQIGYTESIANYIVLDDGVTMKGYTRYGAWYGMPYDDWCAMFASFCLNYAGVPQTFVPYASGCVYWVEQLYSAGLFKSAAECIPEAGFLVFFDTDGDHLADHVGIVTAADGESIQTVEGNVCGAVVQSGYSKADSAILGYCVLPENPNYTPAEPETAEEDDAASDGSSSSDTDELQDDTSSETEEANDEDESLSEDNALAAISLDDGLQTADANSDTESIAVGESKTVCVSGHETVKLSFTPEYSHGYEFYSAVTSGDPQGYLYDANETQLAYNDDGGESWNFKITYTLTGGETYYWGVEWRNSTAEGDIPVYLKLGETHVYSENDRGELVCSCGAIAPISGTCGPDLTWSFDSETGTLSITGSGSMTDYSNSSAPWASIADRIKNVSIGEGATTVGSYAFSGCNALESVSFPSTLTRIGPSAFYSCAALIEANLAGTSVSSIGLNAFQSCTSLNNISFPSTLNYIGQSAFRQCGAIGKIDLSATGVGIIDDSVFANCLSLESVSFPAGLTRISSYAFSRCLSLKEIDLSQTNVTVIGYNAFGDCTALSHVILPKSVISVEQNVFANCAALKELRLEASNAAFNKSQADTGGSFCLTAAGTVDNLSADMITILANMGCTSIYFEGPNYLTGGGWQADFLPKQLNGLPQSEYFIDAQGVFYRIDSETNTASVFYCPPELTSYTVLKELPTLDEKQASIPVTGVDSLAFSEASNLTELTFEAPEVITVLGDMAFYKAVNLEKINGMTVSQDVLDTFTADNLKAGTMLFRQTKIDDGNEQISDKPLDIEKNDLKLTISAQNSQYLTPGQSEDGTYLYYTGETPQTTITVSNPNGSEDTSGGVVRVYFRFDKKGGNISYAPGVYTVKSPDGNEYTMNVVKTDVTDCYYIEVEKPQKGDTISIVIGSSYPSPGSAGGNAAVWGTVLTEDEKASVGAGLTPFSEYLSMNWSTAVDTFPVTKTETSRDSAQLKGDGSGGAYITNLKYAIKMSRSGTTLEGVGKDYMTSANFEDVLTLPEGVVLADDVKESIQNGTVKISNNSSYYSLQTEQGKEILRLDAGTYANLQSVKTPALSLDENGNLVLGWRFVNSDLSTEIADITFKCNISDGVVFVPNPQAEVVYTTDNKVTATQRFMYSEDQTQSDECSSTVKTANSSLIMDKTSSRNSSYMGDAIVYTITASNPGALPYEKLAYISDSMPTSLYMRPSDIAQTFAGDTEHQLTLTVQNATLCTPGGAETVFGIGGTSAVTNIQNSGGGTTYSGMSNTDPDLSASSAITFSWGDENNLLISVEGGASYSCASDGEAIRSFLESIGFVVTPNTQYFLKWDLRNEDQTIPPLVGGGQLKKKVYARCKDTFMSLNNDTLNQYNEYVTANNLCSGRGMGDNQLDYDTDYRIFNREFFLGKAQSLNGEAVNSETTIRDGDILDYTLTITHSGKAAYDALPLTDHMSGAQALLVPASKNSGASWAEGLETVTDNGIQYYVLSVPGTYQNVWTSENRLADSVTVSKTGSGLDTLIKWYFVNYTGNRTDAVAYRSYVCPNEVADGTLSYSLDNESWLNDHQSHRLYATLPGWTGTAFDFDKKIVSSVDDTDTGYINSTISEGETVVYRLMLTSPTDKDEKKLPMTITGKDMYDALPLSIAAYRWNRDNIRITYADDYTVNNGDSWSVTESDSDNRQYINWGDDFSLTFTGTAYIYVELDFPTDMQWQEYASKYGTTELVNSFYVLGAQRSVTHELSTPAQVYLQKGVYDTGYLYGSGYYTSEMNIQDSRLYYQNNDAKDRAVRYYTALYNAGPTNLYLTQMQDILPEGFTYYSANGYTEYSTAAATVKESDGSIASVKQAKLNITTKTDESGRQTATFSFSKSTTDNSVSYDEKRGMCYLKPGETIIFAYICKTNDAADTDDAALNTITMPYYDFNGGGVVVDDGCSVIGANADKYTPNDGGCDLMDNGQAENMGFIGGTTDTQWLSSHVTQIRGSIKPGITKALSSKTDSNGTTTLNPVSAAPADTLNWSVTTENDGTNSISDYVLTDRMQSPYMFTGNVNYTVYGSAGSTAPVAKPDLSNYLFTMAKGSDDEHITVTTNRYLSYELTIGGEPITISCNWAYSIKGSYSYTKNVNILLSVTKDTDNNAVLSLRFPDKAMAIPESGKSVLTLSTDNPSNILENKQLVNTAFITPIAQVWDNTTNKGNVTTLNTPYGDGEMSTVRNSSPITLSYGYVTASSKSITEAGNPGNNASCADDKNYIVLENAEKEFIYTLSVSNTTPKAMDKFILIDGLPQIGDHTSFVASDPRFSEFKVSLADEPNFTVTVTDESGNTTVLDADSYAIEFSDKTDFGADDWKGTSAWSASAENARSIRLTILDSDGTLIPAGSAVYLTFTCKIDDPAVQPGQVAWNSFGYHYSLIDEVAELESAPLKVGVKVPSIPEVRKQIVDHSGRARAMDEDKTFAFLVFPGTVVNGNYTTRDEWIAALGETPYEEYTVTVSAGTSISDAVRLETTKWIWTDGQQYTVVELPCGEDFTFKRFVGSASKTYALTYTAGQTQLITCENTAQRWNIALTKENTSHEPLSGAMFALYSQKAEDQPVPNGIITIEPTVEYNGKTWYFVDVKTTPEDGKLSWDNLSEEEYYLMEVKAPDGYYLSPTGQILKREQEKQGSYSVTVINYAGYSLPETGGIGTLPFAIGGLLLQAGGFLYGSRLWRKRGRRSS